MLECLIIIYLTIYLVLLYWLLNGNFKEFSKSKSEFPFISIVIAARNEESVIKRCLLGIEKLNYPKNKFEVIVIDDNSSDNTSSVIKEFISSKDNFHSYFLDDKNKKVDGKAGALEYGFSIAKGEIVLITDADCRVNPDWARALVKHFSGNVAAVCGITTQKYRDLFEKIQAIDFEMLLFTASGAMNNGLLMSAMGNNMAIRREVYDKIGGYRNIKFSLTEDFQLLKEIDKTGKYKLIFSLNRSSLVYSLPCKNISQILSQKRRWFAGIKDVSFKSLLLLVFLYSLHLLLIIGIFSEIQSAIFIIIKVLFDYLYYRANSLKLNITKGLFSFIIYELYLFMYVLIIPVSFVFSKKIKWKGKSYNAASV